MSETKPAAAAGADHSAVLATLARASKPALHALAETLLQDMGELRVIRNRTGLVMLPMRDTVQHVDFHLGEVLVSEAHIEDAQGRAGYGMITGRDLQSAMAMAVVDLAYASGRETARIGDFLAAERRLQDESDRHMMRRVEATRVEMETF